MNGKSSVIRLLLVLLTELWCADLDNQNVNKVPQASVKTKRQMVKEGSLVHLTCKTEHPWFFCLWKSPKDERECALNFKKRELESKCKNNRLLLKGTENSCDIQMKALSTDHGSWMCVVIYKNFDSIKMYQDLEVAVEATVVIQFDGGEHKNEFENNNDTQSENETVLHMDEGEEKSVSCSARGAFPKSQLSWTLNYSTSSDLDVSSQEIIKEYKDDHRVDTTQKIILTGRLDRNNTSLQCWSRQINRAGKVVFVKSSSIRLNVHSIAAASLIFNIGPLLIMLLFLLILVFLCIIFAFQRKQKWKKEEKKKVIQIEVPTNSCRRRVSYDQNMNKLRLKKEHFEDFTLKNGDIKYNSFGNKWKDSMVIVSAQKASSLAYSEMETEFPTTSSLLVPKFSPRPKSHKASSLVYTEMDTKLPMTSNILTSKSPPRSESQQISSLEYSEIDTELPRSSSIIGLKSPTRSEFRKSPSKILFNERTECEMSPLKSSNSEKLPSKSSSTASLSASALNTIISRTTNDDIDDVTVTSSSDHDDFNDASKNGQNSLDSASLSPPKVVKPPDAKDSVFYCEEGCFNLLSPCTHVRVAISTTLMSEVLLHHTQNKQ